MSKSYEDESTFKSFANMGLYARLYLVSREKRESQCQLFLSELDEKTTMKIVKSATGTIPNWFFKIFTPKITFSKTVYIP